MIGVAICGGLFCAFAAGCCFGYAIHKQRPKPELENPDFSGDFGRGSGTMYMRPMGVADPPHPLHREWKRNAKGQFAK